MKNLFFSTLLMLSIIPANAQLKFTPAFRAGMNISTITHSGLDAKTGLYFGVSGAFALGKKYLLQPEFNFSDQGAKGDFSQEVSYFDENDNYITEIQKTHIDVSFRYLSVAIINKFQLTKDFSFFGGPSIDFLTSTYYGEWGYNKKDVSLVCGVDYSFYKGLGLELRLKKGFNQILNKDFEALFNNESQPASQKRNLVIQVGIVYDFDLKK